MASVHRHCDTDDRLRFLEDMLFKLFLGLVAGGFMVIAALIGFIAILLAK
jgi:hypothetical protein